MFFFLLERKQGRCKCDCPLNFPFNPFLFSSFIHEKNDELSGIGIIIGGELSKHNLYKAMIMVSPPPFASATPLDWTVKQMLLTCMSFMENQNVKV